MRPNHGSVPTLPELDNCKYDFGVQFLTFDQEAVDGRPVVYEDNGTGEAGIWPDSKSLWLMDEAENRLRYYNCAQLNVLNLRSNLCGCEHCFQWIHCFTQ